MRPTLLLGLLARAVAGEVSAALPFRVPVPVEAAAVNAKVPRASFPFPSKKTIIKKGHTPFNVPISPEVRAPNRLPADTSTAFYMRSALVIIFSSSSR